jgi:N-acetylneuraminate synthase
MEPTEMAQLVQETERAWRALGEVTYGATEAETKSIQFRRSLYIVKDLKAGDILTKENLRCIRPGYGLAPKFYDELLGRAVARDLVRGTAMNLKFVDAGCLQEPFNPVVFPRI